MDWIYCMKYFRKHPDLILLANYPEGTHRIRHARRTTPTQLSKILVNTITSSVDKTKKILLLTDATDTKQHAGCITRTAWTMNNPFSLLRLINRFIYNHETRTICILYHPELFGRFWTSLCMPLLLVLLRLTGKQITILFLTTPKLSSQPTIGQTLRYFMRRAILVVLRWLATQTVGGEKSTSSILIPMTFRSLKERRIAGKIIHEELFPSPTHNLGLSL